MSPALDSYSVTPVCTVGAFVPGGGDFGGADWLANAPSGGSWSTYLDWNGTDAIGVPHEFSPDNPDETTDETAPVSGTGVLRHRIDPASFPPNTQLGGGAVIVSSLDASEFYVARALKFHDPFLVDGEGCKSMLVPSAESGSVYFNYDKIDEGIVIRPIVLMPQDADHDMRNDTWLSRTTTTPFPLGEWGMWEFYLKMNTPGVQNGVMRVWANGVLQLEFTDWRFAATGEDPMWLYVNSNFHHNNGQSPAISQIQTIYMDHMTIKRIAA